ncbi:MAG: diaminopimelate epimerase [Lachnospiraceae bacterium]
MNLKKYHGLGNDYLVYDPNVNDFELNEERVKLICHRNYGIGSDGILYGPIRRNNNIHLLIYNPDGSTAEKSGNGVRIFSKYLKDMGYITKSMFQLHTDGGVVEVEYLNNTGSLMKVQMGTVSFLNTDIIVTGNKREVIDEIMTFNGTEYRVTCLSIGNPHCVIPMDEISRDKACAIGPFVENSAGFPNRINMQLLKIIDRKNIQIEIYERGAGYTLASGSSSCAAASAAYKLGLTESDMTVHMPGGTLMISINDSGEVFMTGEVENVGEIFCDQQFINKLSEI